MKKHSNKKGGLCYLISNYRIFIYLLCIRKITNLGSILIERWSYFENKLSKKWVIREWLYSSIVIRWRRRILYQNNTISLKLKYCVVNNLRYSINWLLGVHKIEITLLLIKFLGISKIPITSSNIKVLMERGNSTFIDMIWHLFKINNLASNLKHIKIIEYTNNHTQDFIFHGIIKSNV